MTKIAQRQFLTKVAGLEGFWATFSGGEVSVEHSRVFDGGALTPDLLTGNPTISDITVSRGYDVTRDGPIRANLQRALAQGRSFETTITRTPTDEDYTPTGPPEVYEVKLKTVTPSDADANSADAARLQLVFSTRSVK